MDSINVINVGGVDKEIEDTVARTSGTAAASRLTTVERNLTQLTARVDGIATLPEGSTSGDAELMDIRIDADGGSHASAGDSVRAQILGVRDEIDDQIEVVRNEMDTKLTVFTNLYNYNDPDVIIGGYYNANGVYKEAATIVSSGFIPVTAGKRYRCSRWSDEVPVQTTVTFWDLNKAFVSGMNSIPTPYVEIPDNVHYIRIISYKSVYKEITFCKGEKQPPNGIPYGSTYPDLYNDLMEYHYSTPYDTGIGVLINDGTINDGPGFRNIIIRKYRDFPSGKLYINGRGSFTLNHGFCYIWYIKNGVMTNYELAVTNPQEFNYFEIDVDKLDIDEVWTCSGNGETAFSAYYKSAIDNYARDTIDKLQLLPDYNQWAGKKWYAYGTSITSVHQGTGKFPPYLEEMSGMILYEKGVGGGGIGDFGAYSTGQVYSAICNITDGKLEADLITIETGANDVTASTPLGTIYDTGQSTLAGCLNDCIRYLQENTDAQIAVTPSPVRHGAFDADYQAYLEWSLMIEQICAINRVHFLKPDNNMGIGKLNSSKRSLYVQDSIHQTELGGYVMAENLWYQIKNIPVFRTSIPE